MVEQKAFSELSNDELYAILRLRSQVFVLEQYCIYLDPDNMDQNCFHLFIKNENKIVACARVVPPGLEYEEASLGRLAVDPKYRDKGYAKELTQACVDLIIKEYPNSPIKIMAQVYLKSFYASFGFKVLGEEFREDHLPHVNMIRT